MRYLVAKLVNRAVMAAKERAGELGRGRNGELLVNGNRVIVTPDNYRMTQERSAVQQV